MSADTANRTSTAQEFAPPAPLTLVTVELRKAVDTLTGKWLVGVTGLLVVGALVVAAFFVERPDWGFESFLLLAVIPLGLLLPVLGVLLLSGEFSQRTTLTTLVLVPSRAVFVLTKTVAAVLLAVAGLVVTVALTAAMTGVLSVIEPGTSWSVDGLVLLQLLAAQVIFVLVGVGFGLLFQNTPLAVVVFLLLPPILTSLFLFIPALREVGPWVDFGTGTAPLLFPEVLSGRQWAQVGTSTALWFGLPFVLGWLRLQRRDIA